ncbi:hypothetical protein F442_01627 [Phytophthora nicotianae P10297]|uniref:Cyclic nucleotide-binding domain-containing protein n=1 Tax=Phytophthora nicotianae P10297 TaxID=1317064 RepID=W3A2K9_PHYNI|nr:hypothetical protein F442_01627 [Phytophthora nicotianae P10297]
MARNKVRPRTDALDGPNEVLLVSGSGPSSSAVPVSKLRRVLQQAVHSYHIHLSWTTRQTFLVVVNLFGLLYLFVTVPFRVAFYYDPYDDHHSWTKELTVFTAIDTLIDLIALVQFRFFFSRWRRTQPSVFSATSEVTSTRRSDTNTLTRTPSFIEHQRQGKVKWTIATILSASSMPETVVSKRTQLRLELLLELVALVPVEVIPIALRAFNVLHLVRITKLCRLYKLRRCFARIAKLYSHRAWSQHLSSTGVDTLVRTIGVCAGLCHWAACGYMLIAHLQCGVGLEFCHQDTETSWVVRDRLFGASVARKYGRTLYWASRTLVLLGYDDVTPVSNAETLYTVVVVLMGALCGSSLLANFLFLFRFRNARYAAYTTHVDNAREYMRSRNIPRPLRHQVMAFFSYSWNAHQSLDGEEALRLMPKHLQSKVVFNIKASRLKQVCFLTKESIEFTNMLALALVRRVYSPGDQIIEPKINAETFFVIRGKVVVSAFNGSNAKEFSAGEFFADICLLDPEQYEQKAVAKTFCELYVLAKSKFDEALKEFYRGNEADVRLRMTDTLDKYLNQLQKMQKMLGMQGIRESGSRKMLMSSHSLIAEDKTTAESVRGISWQHPGSYFSVLWDTARLAAIVYVAFEVPYFAVFITMGDEADIFMVQQDVSLRYVLTVLVEVLLGIDLFLRARYFSYLDPNVMLNVVQPSLIFENYKANGFYIDLVAWLPVGLVLDFLPAGTIHGYSAIFRLLRMLRIRLIPSLLANLADFYGLSSKLQTVVFLVLGVTLMLHVVGCAWFQMTLIEQDSDSLLGDIATMSALTRPECLEQATKFQNCTWVIYDCYSHIGVTFPVENPESMYQAPFAYLRSLYWAVVTLTAVGYGDIVAYSTAESYFAAFWIFVGGIINFGVVGAMSSTISNAMAPHHHYMEKINTLNHVLERMEVSEHLSGEIRRFYHQQFTGRKQCYESQLLSNLPDQLCYKISSLLHSEAVKCIPLFNSASTGFLKEVTGKFRHRSYQNGETICLEGDVCRKFFVFLHNSKVNLFFRLRKAPVRALCNGDSYGVNEFLLRRPYPATIRAAAHVQASVMTREQFDVIQRKFAKDVGDMKSKAEALVIVDQNRLERIVANLEKLKLQPHSMHTPTLFYQRDNALITKGTQQLVRGIHLRESLTTVWNALVTSWNVYNAFFVIFRIFAAISSFALDIYLRLYYFGCPDVGLENLIERKEVDKQYRRSSMLKWDILASLPLYTPFASGSLTASLCRLPRLIRCIDIWTYLDDGIILIQQHFASHNVSAYLSPVKLMIILVLVAHYVGCIFFWISEHECEHVQKCWVDNDHLLHQYHHSLIMLYAKSFYWATTTLLLVGSRESVPRDTAGTLWTGFTCLCCTFIIGHIVGEISELILELGKETKHYKSHVASFESFAKKHELPQTLRDRITYFFRVHFEHTKGSDLFATVHDLSANLRLKLMLEIYGNSIANLPICRFLTASQVNNLALRLKPELFIPGDDILVEGTYGNRLCTLRKGMAGCYWTSAVAAVAILMEGAFFGEIAFFLPNQRRLATVKATTFCEVLYVSKHDWQELWASSGNAADTHVQKHALHAILGWVSSRLQRYQNATLRAAKQVKHFVYPPSEEGNIKTQPQSNHKTGPGILRAATPPRRMSQAEVCRLFVHPEVQLLEKKAEYLLTKSDECTEKFSPAIASIQARRSSSIFATVRRSVTQSRDRTTVSHGSQWKSGNSDASFMIKKSTGDTTADIRQLQFIVDLNPLNKHIYSGLSTQRLRSMERECWSRFGVLAEAQRAVDNLLNQLVISDNTQATRRPEIKIQPGRKGKRLRLSTSFRLKKRNMEAPKVKSSLKSTLKVGKTPLVSSGGNKTRQKRRRLSVAAVNERPQVGPSNSEHVATDVRRSRCFSLPVIETDFLRVTKRKQAPSLSKTSGISFEILQRCQRPQYAKQLHWYHLYRQWRASTKASASRVLPNLSTGSKRGSIVSPTGIPSFRSFNRPRGAAVGSRLQLPSQRALFSATTDLQSQVFIRRVKELGKLWDFVMLTIAVYHLIVTPFKISFSPALIELSDGTLRSWSIVEMLLDVLCLVDVLYQLQHASTMQQNIFSASNSSKNGLHHALTANPELRSYIVAMLPLELLLLASNIRVPIPESSMLHSGASWWTTRWLLRMNCMLLLRRIEPLSEQLIQFMVHDLKIPVSEEMLYFIRGLASYLATGHLLACIWFITSETGFHQYGTSWLATSGMLTYIADESTVVEHARRMLSQTASTFSLDTVSLIRKYLRSFLFSIECISTLFYGDILSMNPLELVAEIIITFWSIYIYGALVGAQAELLDARAKSEAKFEQRLGELHHYVLQNDVPKTLRRQIKAYYARLWVRGRGESEFSSVKKVSRLLYEDVVSTTLRHFAAQVKAFRGLEEHFLRALLVCLQYVVCEEDEEIVMKGDVDRSMYFIAQGRVLVKTDASGVTKERGEYFGELTLLYGISRLETCVALTVTELHRLDHEPYERLLLEFPEYRARNKLAWTTFAETVRVVPQFPPRLHRTLASRPSIARVVPTTAENMESRLQFSFVLGSSMKMLASLQSLHPLEAKDLILKCRDGARKHLLRCVTPVSSNGAQAEHSDTNGPAKLTKYPA